MDFFIPPRVCIGLKTRVISTGDMVINNAMPVYEVTSEEETIQIAHSVAAQAKKGDVYLLSAPMGAGKSVFARAFIQSLCGKDTDVPSPTFTLVQMYDSPTAPIWHFDLYRLAHEEEVLNIGWDDALTADNICLIEWPEKAGFYLPKIAKNITIDILEETRRRIWVNEP